MFCCVTNPDLARLLAGEAPVMPDEREGRLVAGAILIQVRVLLLLGALPWS